MSDTARMEATVDRLTAASHALTYAASLDEVLEITVASAEHLMDAECVALLLPGEGGALRIGAARGIEAGLVRDFSAVLDEFLLQRLSDALGRDGDERRLLAVPLVVTGRVVGLLAVLLRGRDPEERDEWLLSALADQASVALDGARIASGKEELEERLASLEVRGRRHEHALRVVQHDLRTPLAAMNGYLELLARETYGPVTDRQRRVLDRLRVAAGHVDSLLANVGEMARLQAGEVTLDPTAVEVSTVVEEARGLVQHLTRERGSEVVTSVPRGLRALADADRLRRVIVQLLDNALRYSPRGSEVFVAASTDDAPPGMIAVRVSDTGAGIEPEHAEEVFEPYRRFASAPGSGLGLWIGREIARLMEGDLVLERSEGPGATFAVYLPLD